LLNKLIQADDGIFESVPPQRRIFLMKHLIQCVQAGLKMPGLLTEILKLLRSVLPHVRELYGSHWADILDILSSLWAQDLSSDDNLPVLHSSLRLFAQLRIFVDDSNDDLEDAWKESNKNLSTLLISSLGKFGKTIATPHIRMRTYLSTLKQILHTIFINLEVLLRTSLRARSLL
jgi:hypothetical protein